MMSKWLTKQRAGQVRKGVAAAGRKTDWAGELLSDSSSQTRWTASQWWPILPPAHVATTTRQCIWKWFCNNGMEFRCQATPLWEISFSQHWRCTGSFYSRGVRRGSKWLIKILTLQVLTYILKNKCIPFTPGGKKEPIQMLRLTG